MQASSFGKPGAGRLRWPGVVLGLALACFAVCPAGSAQRGHAAAGSGKWDHLKNVHEARVNLAAEARPLDEVVKAVRCGEAFLLALAQRKLATVAVFNDTPALDLLMAVERCTEMAWSEVDLAFWQLARDQAHASALFLAPPGRPGPDTVEDFARTSTGLKRQLIRSLTRDQWSRLAGGLVLQFNELRPDQQRLLLDSLDASVFGGYGSSGPTREARQGRVAIYMTDLLNPSRDLGLGFAYPSRMMPGYQPLGKTREELDYATGVFIQANPDGTYGPSNPFRRLYPPGRTPRRPADPSPEEDRKDPRLQRVLDLGEDPPAWEKLVGAMQKATELAVFLEGDYLKKPAPFAVRKLSVLEVMDRLAEHTGRRWERIGELRVLAPIPDEEKKPPSGATRADRTSTPSR